MHGSYILAVLAVVGAFFAGGTYAKSQDSTQPFSAALSECLATASVVGDSECSETDQEKIRNWYKLEYDRGYADGLRGR